MAHRAWQSQKRRHQPSGPNRKRRHSHVQRCPMVQGVSGDIRRVIRNPMNEHEGWNTVEVIVRGDGATYIVNGKVNNRATKIEQIADNAWVPLDKGKIALQLEYAEVYYRNV